MFAYVIEGKGCFCPEKEPFSYEVEGTNYFDMQAEPMVGNGSLVLFADGDQIAVSTENNPVRFLLISGKPIHEPVAWYRPIVMNTEDELRIAFDEYRDGTFIKCGKRKFTCLNRPHFPLNLPSPLFAEEGQTILMHCTATPFPEGALYP